MDKKLLKIAKQRKRCCFCGKKMILQRSIIVHAPQLILSLATYEHKIPKSQGGTRSYENGVASCLECNGKRGLIDFDTFIKIRGDHVLWLKFEKMRWKFYKKMKRKRKDEFCWREFNTSFYDYFLSKDSLINI